ncbi:hypothetical protein V6N11_076319 [Hibiscus sabdariffa]|uniref:peptidylprolyl isomerase n=1 Tax=Hibiscus sabdariffa TaxID=183260 RepID=A0ABR2Q5W7_9ROSI
MVDGFPFEVPEEYRSMPLLKGRAAVDMKVKVKDNPNLEECVFHIVLDGYNAPVTAGNFVDLVQRRFYDGMEIQRADGFVVQTGDPEGPAEGFIDPSTEKTRTIPLEIMVGGEKTPFYGATLEELGLYKAQTKLPFNAFGTMAMARDEFEDNSASSQVFWLLKESELTPSNANILDGRYAVFGYVTENQDFLADLKVGDVIESIQVVSGLQNLVNPSYKIAGMDLNFSESKVVRFVLNEEEEELEEGEIVGEEDDDTMSLKQGFHAPYLHFLHHRTILESYNNIHHPSKLAVGADFHCFKHKIEPKWEDPVCANGGKWTVTFQKGKSDNPWLYTLLALIGEQFDYVERAWGNSGKICLIATKLSGRCKEARQRCQEPLH